MIAHLRALSVIQSIRCVVGLGIGVFLIWRSYNFPSERLLRLEPWDRTFFLVAGLVFVSLAVLRGIQGVWTLISIRRSRRGRSPGSLKSRAMLRRLGIILAIVDVIDLVGFPLTTGCGTYGILIYRHPDVRDLFEGVFSNREAVNPIRTDEEKLLRKPGTQERKNPSPPVPGFLDS